jgi:hypothetical protein
MRFARNNVPTKFVGPENFSGLKLAEVRDRGVASASWQGHCHYSQPSKLNDTVTAAGANHHENSNEYSNLSVSCCLTEQGDWHRAAAVPTDRATPRMSDISQKLGACSLSAYPGRPIVLSGFARYQA